MVSQPSFHTLTAQQAATATLSGRIVDPNGAVLSGAQITATQKSTGVKRETKTNDEGLYVLTNLPVGDYEVSIQYAGATIRTFFSQTTRVS